MQVVLYLSAPYNEMYCERRSCTVRKVIRVSHIYSCYAWVCAIRGCSRQIQNSPQGPHTVICVMSCPEIKIGYFGQNNQSGFRDLLQVLTTGLQITIIIISADISLSALTIYCILCRFGDWQFYKLKTVFSILRMWIGVGLSILCIEHSPITGHLTLDHHSHSQYWYALPYIHIHHLYFIFQKLQLYIYN